MEFPRIKKLYNRILWHVKELNKTFSNEPSYYSSKRIERAILFTCGTAFFTTFCFMNIKKMTPLEASECFAVYLIYAGFILKQTKLDKQQPTQLTQ